LFKSPKISGSDFAICPEKYSDIAGIKVGLHAKGITKINAITS